MKEYLLTIRHRKLEGQGIHHSSATEYAQRCSNYYEQLRKDGVLVREIALDIAGIILSKVETGWHLSEPGSESQVTICAYIVQAESLPDAVSIARRNPEVETQMDVSVEVREILLSANTDESSADTIQQVSDVLHRATFTAFPNSSQ